MTDEYVLLDDSDLAEEERSELAAFLTAQPGVHGIKFRKRASDTGAILNAMAKSFTPTKVIIFTALASAGKPVAEIAKSLIQDWLKKKLLDKNADETETVDIYDHNGDVVVRVKKKR
jgi:hypothetical protein